MTTSKQLLCSKCRAPHDRIGQRYCRKCHAANMRAWRPDHPLVGEPRKKLVARSYAKTYLKRGRLHRQSCTVCGDPKSEMHHPDHEHPLMVTWLCRGCHLAWHAFWKSVVLDIFENWTDGARNFSREKPAGNPDQKRAA